MDINEQIEAVEKELMDKKKELVELRKIAPKITVGNFTFKSHSENNLDFSDLFFDREELILVFNMGKRCPYCTLWADGYNGLVHHLNDRASFVVVSPDSVDVQKEFSSSRNWKFTMVSCKDMDFYKQMDFFNGEEGSWPGVASFIKDENGNIIRYAKSYFGPGDNFCAMWDFNDLLPPQEKVWEPKYKYKCECN